MFKVLLHVCVEKIKHLTKLETFGNPVILVWEKKTVILLFMKYLLIHADQQKKVGIG